MYLIHQPSRPRWNTCALRSKLLIQKQCLQSKISSIFANFGVLFKRFLCLFPQLIIRNRFHYQNKKINLRFRYEEGKNQEVFPLKIHNLNHRSFFLCVIPKPIVAKCHEAHRTSNDKMPDGNRSECDLTIKRFSAVIT